MTDDASTDSNGPADSKGGPIFPWEKEFDLDRLAEEYAELNGWDLEKNRDRIRRSMIDVVLDHAPGRWISSEIAKLPNPKNSPKKPFDPSGR